MSPDASGESNTCVTPPHFPSPVNTPPFAHLPSGFLLCVPVLFSRCYYHAVSSRRSLLFAPQPTSLTFSTLLSFISTSAAFFNLSREINCHSYGQAAQALGNISIGTATLNILYRAWAISLRHHRSLTASLAIAEVGHWGILAWNVFTVRYEWQGSPGTCSVATTSRPALVTLYIYSTVALSSHPFKTMFLTRHRSNAFRHGHPPHMSYGSLEPQTQDGRNPWSILAALASTRSAVPVHEFGAAPLTTLSRNFLLRHLLHCQLHPCRFHLARPQSCVCSQIARLSGRPESVYPQL
jgi:hypothetical protein